MGEEKVEQQQIQTGSDAQPSEPQTTKSEPSPEQRTIIGLRAEVSRLKTKLSAIEDEGDSSDSEEAPKAKKSWSEENDAEKTVVALQKRIKELESESRRTQLEKEKSDASRDHGIPMEVLADAKSSTEVWRKVSQWHKDVKATAAPEEKPPSQMERSSGGAGGGSPSADKIFSMSADEFERFKQSLRRN